MATPRCRSERVGSRIDLAHRAQRPDGPAARSRPAGRADEAMHQGDQVRTTSSRRRSAGGRQATAGRQPDGGRPGRPPGGRVARGWRRLAGGRRRLVRPALPSRPRLGARVRFAVMGPPGCAGVAWSWAIRCEPARRWRRESSLRDVLRRPGGPHRHPGQLGQLGVGEVVGGPHRGVLAGQPGAEEQRVVGAEGDRGAGLRAGWAAAPRSGRCRRPSATFETGQTSRATPASTIRSSSAGSSTARTPCPSRSACRSSRQVRTLLGPEQLAAVRGQQQAGSLGDRERRARSRRCGPAARRWTGRTRRRPGRRTARPAGPASARPAGAGSGWRRSPAAMPSPVSREAVARPRPARGR